MKVYTQLKNVQITIGILKMYNVKHIILSPGGCDYPIIRSLESDDYFICHSVVDESSSPYVAVGMCDELSEPVGIVCTSGTAAVNFISGLRWAYIEKKRIVAITADRDPKLLGQMETQKVDQMGIFESCTCYNIGLPHVSNTAEFKFCERVLNESLIMMKKRNQPVHINIPTTLGDSLCVIKSLPKIRKIDYIEDINKSDIYVNLSVYKKIIVIVGQTSGFSNQAIKEIAHFRNKYKAIIAVDHLSNLSIEGAIHYYKVAELISERDFENLCPDLVITLGNNYAGERIKRLLRKHCNKICHWSIEPNGRIRDTFYSLEKVFVCSIEEWFERANNIGVKRNDTLFYKSWREWEKKIQIEKLQFSNFLVAKVLCDTVPENSVIHLAILMATRQTQFFKFRKGVKVYSNVGVLGIDGCSSSFLGEASSEVLSYLLVGDLSYFYDITSSLIEPINNNIRIVLVNNFCGAEFHFSSSNTSAVNVNEFVAAGHKSNLKEWAVAIGMEYISVYNEDELYKGAEKLSGKNDKPIFMEVFTDADEDARITRQVYETYSMEAKKRKVLRNIKTAGNSILGEKRMAQLYNMLVRRK